MESWQKLSVSPESSIIETIGVIDREGNQIALVVAADRTLLGTVTDGDVRRGLLKGISLQDPVSRVMNAKPHVVGPQTSRQQILELMRAKGFRHLPMVDEKNRLVGFEYWDALLAPEKKPNPVLLMAGGKGTRLGSLTESCPKPLLKVGGRPILETILLQLSNHGFHQFFVSVHYRAEMIRDYFGDGSKWGVSIRYLEEESEMGTAGALGLIPEKLEHPLLVMNGDLLTKINFDQFLEFHREQKSSATMGIREYDFRVPYGVVRLDGEHLVSIDEKPIQKFFVNAGLYVLDPATLALLPKNVRFDMPDLFRAAMENRQKVAAFPVREYWLDIGKPDDFERANFDFMNVFPEGQDGPERT